MAKSKPKLKKTADLKPKSSPLALDLSAIIAGIAPPRRVKKMVRRRLQEY